MMTHLTDLAFTHALDGPCRWSGTPRVAVANERCDLHVRRCTTSRFRLRFLSLFALLGLVACRSAGPVEGEQPGLSVTTAIVYGRVLTAAGAPVAGATVRANVHGDSTNCRPGGAGLSGGGPATSDAAGNYRQVVAAPVVPTELCVSVRVTPPTGSNLNPGGDAGKRVRMLPEGNSARDSLRVDIRLP